jgi:hypothetical protein
MEADMVIGRKVPIASESADERQPHVPGCDRTMELIVRPYRALQKPMKLCAPVPLFSQWL